MDRGAQTTIKLNDLNLMLQVFGAGVAVFAALIALIVYFANNASSTQAHGAQIKEIQAERALEKAEFIRFQNMIYEKTGRIEGKLDTALDELKRLKK